VSPSGASFLSQLLPSTSMAKLPLLRQLTGYENGVRIFKQGPILQNSNLAENFLDKFTASNFGRLSTQKFTDIYFCKYL
jgi:hypothetical protein